MTDVVSLKSMTKRGRLEEEIEIEIRDDFEAAKTSDAA